MNIYIKRYIRKLIICVSVWRSAACCTIPTAGLSVLAHGLEAAFTELSLGERAPHYAVPSTVLHPGLCCVLRPALCCVVSSTVLCATSSTALCAVSSTVLRPALCCVLCPTLCAASSTVLRAVSSTVLCAVPSTVLISWPPLFSEQSSNRGLFIHETFKIYLTHFYALCRNKSF